MTVTMTGENSFALNKDLRRRIADFTVNHGELSVVKLDAEEAELPEVQETLQGVSLFNPAKLVVIRNLSSNKKLAEKIENILGSADEKADIVLIEPVLDKRGKLYKYLAKNTDLIEFNELDQPELAGWLVDQAKAEGLTLSRKNAMYLIERAGTNQQRLFSELKKLSNIDKEVTKETIDRLVVPALSSSIFDMLSAVFAGRTEEALKLYREQRLQRVEPPQILAMLAWQMHVVALIDSAKNLNPAQLSRQTGLHSFVISKSHPIASKLRRQRIKYILDQLADIDYQMKNKNIDSDEALQNFIVELY